MFHFSAIINWNASERNIEPAFTVNFSILDGAKIGFDFRMILSQRTKFAFPSYENQKEKKEFQGFCRHYKEHFYIIFEFLNSHSRNAFWSVFFRSNYLKNNTERVRPHCTKKEVLR